MELYIHIPFCKRKCEYCSFISFPPEKGQRDQYVTALLEEARLRRDAFNETVRTIFIGGGTPSLLEPEQLRKLVNGIHEIIPDISCEEFTIEANPCTLTREYVEMAVQLGINRFSLGMQACQEKLLNTLGRIHLFSDVIRAVELLTGNGIKNYNLDLIFGIPGQKAEDWDETLDAALSLHPAHISAYGLIPEEGTPLVQHLKAGDYELPDQEEEREMYERALHKLADHGFHQYEISNFALDGFECKHNIGYWTQIPYIGLGLSAASMQITNAGESGMKCIRWKNPDSMCEYFGMIQKKNMSSAEKEIVDERGTRFETMMLGLRMNKGVSERSFFEKHGVSLEKCYGSKLSEMKEKGFLIDENGYWHLTRKGMDFQNVVLVELMDDD